MDELKLLQRQIHDVKDHLRTLQRRHRQLTGQDYLAIGPPPAIEGLEEIRAVHKRTQYHSARYRNWLAKEPCPTCGAIAYRDKKHDVSHQRHIDQAAAGMLLKPGDLYALPGCMLCHRINDHHYGHRLSREEAAVKCLEHINRFLVQGGKF